MPPQHEAYVHWTNTDPRLDCWIETDAIGDPWPVEEALAPKDEAKPTSEVKEEAKGIVTRHRKRARESEEPVQILNASGVAPPNAPSQPRSIMFVVYGWHDIKTWYDSPYQLDEVHSNTANTSLHLGSITNSTYRGDSQPPSGRNTPVGHSRREARPVEQPRAAAPTALEQLDAARRNNNRDLSESPKRNGLLEKPVSAGAKKPGISLHPDPAMDAEMIRMMKRPGSSSSGSSSTHVVQQLVPPSTNVSDSTASTSASNLLNGHGRDDESSMSPPTSPEDTFKPTASSLPSPAFSITIPASSGLGASMGPDGPSRGPGGRFAKKEGPLKKARRTDSSSVMQRELQDLSSFNRAFSPDPETGGSPAPPAKRGQKELQLVPGTGMSLLRNGRLYVCDGCFKYMAHSAAYEAHRRGCKQKFPPGRKVWQRGSQTIWEVDGYKAKLWCQNLCLFGKLFIDHKYVFFDVDGFLFYILCEGDGNRDYMIGFFSKEKVSYDDFNLACIVILPPFQKKGYGVLLIELSYELHRRSKRFLEHGIAGTPERPLSDLGLRGYLAFWTSVLVRYFRRLIAVRSVEALQKMDEERHALATQRRVKKLKGWVTNQATTDAEHAADLVTQNHEETDFAVRLTVEQVATATGLRIDDTILALTSCGLLCYVDGSEDFQMDEATVLVITPESIERVAQDRKIKPALLELACMLHDEPE